MSESLQDNSECTKIFYGLFIPKEDKQDEDCISVHSVYTDKEEVLRVVKKFKDSRFKAFHTYDEALAFADGDPSLALSPKLAPQPKNADISNKEIEPPVSEGTSAFKFPKHQELTKLLKAIERGDEQYFVDTVWSNPYFLISSGDTPAILQEGCRYNALHVAAKSSQTQMVVLILETIENPFFLQLLFVDDNEEMCKQRMKYLVDLYLNTPDKAICETPLHFASKFGCSSIVKILTAHPLCEKNPKNKYGETPKEIACSRSSNKSAELKKEIESYFEPQYYVPILFREDNSTQAILVKPLSYNETHLSQISGTVASPIVPSMKERAYAGPMPLSQAEEFYKKFKKYNVGEGINLHGTGFSDYEKGLERIGRMLSRELKVKWIEYWPCLNTYCDITSEEGLKLLESFFEEKLNSYRVLQENEINISNNASSGDLEDDSGNLSKNSSGISILCDAIQNYYLKPEIADDTICTVSSLTSNEDIFVTPPSSPNSSPYGSVCSLESLDDCPPFFVEGFCPTKSDVDILRALKDIPINADDYPLICRWKNHILSFPDDISNGWPSPYSPRCASSSSKFAYLQNSPHKSESRSRNIFSYKKNLFGCNPHTDADADIYQ